jgi:hypothetical protein
MADDPSTVLDYLPPEAIVLLDDGAAIDEAVNEQEEQALEQARLLKPSGGFPPGVERPYLPLDELREALHTRGAIDLGYLTAPDRWVAARAAFPAGPRPPDSSSTCRCLLTCQVDHGNHRCQSAADRLARSGRPGRRTPVVIRFERSARRRGVPADRSVTDGR